MNDNARGSQKINEYCRNDPAQEVVGGYPSNQQSGYRSGMQTITIATPMNINKQHSSNINMIKPGAGIHSSQSFKRKQSTGDAQNFNQIQLLQSGGEINTVASNEINEGIPQDAKFQSNQQIVVPVQNNENDQEDNNTTDDVQKGGDFVEDQIETTMDLVEPKMCFGIVVPTENEKQGSMMELPAQNESLKSD